MQHGVCALKEFYDMCKVNAVCKTPKNLGVYYDFFTF